MAKYVNKSPLAYRARLNGLTDSSYWHGAANGEAWMMFMLGFILGFMQLQGTFEGTEYGPWYGYAALAAYIGIQLYSARKSRKLASLRKDRLVEEFPWHDE